MSKILLIAEKPSVAEALAHALETVAPWRQNGYLEAEERLYSWCYGHLGQYADAKVYDARFATWRQEDLPILPQNWIYEIAPGKQKQLAVLQQLLARADIGEVVNCCDAGREGESIFRHALEKAAVTEKTITRLWNASLEDAAIRESFQNRKGSEHYDRLYAAAECRAKADYLIGINATRQYTLLYGKLMQIGRVVSPTLAMLVERTQARAQFVPEKTWQVYLELSGFTAQSAAFSDEAEARALAEACRAAGVAIVTQCAEKTLRQAPPTLFDLTELQRYSNRVHGYTAQQTLDTLQALYEKKLCTYPRTDSRYLTDDMAAHVPELVAIAAGVLDLPVPESIHRARVCDSKRVTDHTALLPTQALATQDLQQLTPQERCVLQMVCQRLLVATDAESVTRKRTVDLLCAEQPFHAETTQLCEAGWKRYEKAQVTVALPPLEAKQTLPVQGVRVQQHLSTPPRPYTEDTLLQSMAEAVPASAGAGARGGLGTPATRAETLEKLLQNGQARREKDGGKTYMVPTELGERLVSVLPPPLRSPEMTASWEAKLCQVEAGTLPAETFMAEIEAFTRSLTDHVQADPALLEQMASLQHSVGTCPRCGGQVRLRPGRGGKCNYVCEKPGCSFFLTPRHPFLAQKKVKLTEAMVTQLLQKGEVPVKNLYSAKTGKRYAATLCLADNGTQVQFYLRFPGAKA